MFTYKSKKNDDLELNQFNKLNIPSLEDCCYISCFCEENVWKLCEFVKNHQPNLLPHCYAIFISNRSQTIPLWNQKSGKLPGNLAVWDYHVIFLYKPSSNDSALVYDLDTILPFPFELGEYATLTFQKDAVLQSNYHRHFRIVPAEAFLNTFASDRSRMKNSDGSWIKEPPPYPCIYTSGKQLFTRLDTFYVDKKGGEMLEALLDREEDRCYGKSCSHSEECCTGAACIDIEGVSGTCLPIHGKEFYQPCQKDADCGFGLMCAESGNFSPSKTCQLDGKSILKKKGFNDECVSSSDCDTANGLCCQIMRRHRMAPKKLCYYFQDPESCIGRVVTHLKPLNFIPNPFFKARLG